MQDGKNWLRTGRDGRSWLQTIPSGTAAAQRCWTECPSFLVDVLVMPECMPVGPSTFFTNCSQHFQVQTRRPDVASRPSRTLEGTYSLLSTLYSLLSIQINFELVRRALSQAFLIFNLV